MRIGIDARAAAEVPAGRGRVVRELLRALTRREAVEGPHYVLYTRTRWPEVDLDERFRWVQIDARDPLWHVRAARAANRECDAFLSTNSYLTARFLRIPCVPIVHDLVTFDDSLHPNRRSRIIERLTLGAAVRRSAAFIAVSQATADELARHFPATVGRTTVAHLGVSPALLAAHTPAASGVSGGPPAAGGVSVVGAPDDAGPELDATETALPAPGFVLAAGTLEPRKNLPRLVDAYRSLPAALRAAHPLVVVGALGWQTGATLAALESLGPAAIRLGHVSDAELAELYRRCAVFCFPSLGEGFGLPVLEAMAAGAAVLTSNTSSLPEVGGDATAYADPRDTQSIARVLRDLLESDARRAELGRRAAKRAAEFSWERFAETVLAVLGKAM